MAAIRMVLREARPDICGLQEVWAEGGRNLAADLAEELGMHWAWVRSPEPERWHARLPGCSAAVGNALLARWPISRSVDVVLPAGGSGDGSRTALASTVESPDGRIPVVTTQLTSAPWDSATRCAQVRTLVALLAGLEREDYPVVALGDMNAEPDSDEMRLLCGHKTAPARERCVLVDAWRYAPEGAEPWTWDRAIPMFSPPWSRARESTTFSSGRLTTVSVAISARSAASAQPPSAVSGPRITRASLPSWARM